MEKKINLTEQDKIKKRIDVSNWELKVRNLEQENLMREKDLNEDIPNKMARLRIRENNVEIEKLKWDIKITQKMLRVGQETVEEITPKDMQKFNDERNKK